MHGSHCIAGEIPITDRRSSVLSKDQGKCGGSVRKKSPENVPRVKFFIYPKELSEWKEQKIKSQQHQFWIAQIEINHGLH